MGDATAFLALVTSVVMYLPLVSSVDITAPFKRSMSVNTNAQCKTCRLQVLWDATAFLTLVAGVVMYVMDVHGVATHLLHLADACLLCLQDCLMLVGVLMLTFETVLPLTVKVMFWTLMTTMQAQMLYCYCMCSCLTSQIVASLTLN